MNHIATIKQAAGPRFAAPAALALALALAMPAGPAEAQPCNTLIVPNFGANGVVRAAVEYDGHLIIGGVPCHNLARWDGASGEWHAFGASQNPVSIVHSHGDGLVGYVRTDTLVCRWDGNEWTVIGAASGGSVFIFSMIVFEGDVYVGGFFQSMNGVPTVGIARWDGNDWHPVGAGLGIGVWALAEHDGELYAGGIFSQSGGEPITRVARWDGISGGWNSMGSGPPMSNASALGSYAGQLVAAGNIGGEGVLARWDGISWEQLGGNFSTDNPHHAIVVSGISGILLVGGHHENEKFIQFWQNCASACCINGECVPLTEEQCAAVGGTSFGTGFGCDDVECEPAGPMCAADLDNSGAVGVADLLILLSQWGPCP